MQYTHEAGYKYALRLISFKDYSIKRLHNKLLAKGFNPQTTMDIVNKLVENGYIDEKKQVDRYLENIKVNKNCGNKLFIQKLKIDEYALETIEYASNLYSKTEEKIILSELFAKVHKKSKYIDIDWDKKKRRIYSYLLRKGFSAENILNLFNEYQRNKGEI